MLNQYITNKFFKQHIAFFEIAFPNYQLIAEADKVVVRATMPGMQNGAQK